MSSIAVSAIVRPSRMLHLAMLGMCLCVLAAGALIGSGWMGSLSPPGRLAVFSVSIGSSLFALYCHLKSRKSLRIDISGIGQIRLMEHTDGAQALAGREGDGKRNWVECQMKEGSVLWTNLLFLHLKSSQGNSEFLRILPDSVTRDEFRALYVATRWIADRRDSISDAA